MSTKNNNHYGIKNLLDQQLTREQHDRDTFMQNNKDKFLSLFAQEKNISIQEAQEKIQKFPEIQQEFEERCKAMLAESELLQEQDKQTQAREKMEKTLGNTESLPRDTLVDGLAMDNIFLKLIAENPIKLTTIPASISSAMGRILIRRIADKVNTTQNIDESTLFGLKKNYLKKNSKGTYSPNLDTFIIDSLLLKDIAKYDILKDVEISGIDIVRELEQQGYRFNTQAKNAYTVLGLSTKRTISDFLAWKEFNQPSTPEENKQSTEQILDTTYKTVCDNMQYLFQKSGEDNGLENIFKQKIVGSNLNYAEYYAKRFSILNSMRKGENFEKEDLIKQIDKKTLGLNIQDNKTKLSQNQKEQLHTFTQLKQELENNPESINLYNKKIQLGKEIRLLEQEINRLGQNNKNREKVSAFEKSYKEKKELLFQTHLQEYCHLAKIQKDDQALATFQSMLILSKKKFSFSAIDEQQQEAIISNSILPQLMDKISNKDICTILGIDKSDIQKFIQQLLDLKRTEISFPMRGRNTTTLPITRNFNDEVWNLARISSLSLLSQPPQLNELGKFPLDFSLDISQLSREEQEYLRRHPFVGKYFNNNRLEQVALPDIIKLLYSGSSTNLATEYLPELERKQKTEVLAQKFHSTSQETKIANLKKTIEEISKNETSYEKDRKQFNYRLENGSYYDEVYANAKISNDSERIQLAQEKLNRLAEQNNIPTLPFTLEQEKAIIEAHTIGEGEIGADGKHLAGVFNYTPEHIRKKFACLKKVGFKTWQIKGLIYYGFCGRIPEKIIKDKIEDIYNELYNSPDPDISRDYEQEIKDFYHTLDNKDKGIFSDMLEEKIDELRDKTTLTKQEENTLNKLDILADTIAKENLPYNPNTPTPNNPESTPDIPNNDPEKSPEQLFESAWNEIGGDSNAKFEVGNCLYLNVGESNFPPFDNHKSWVRLKITGIHGGKGTGRFSFKLENASSDIADISKGMPTSLPATTEQLKELVGNFGVNNIKRVKGFNDVRDFKSSLSNLINSGLLGNNSSIFGDEKIFEKEGKFYKKNEEGKDVEVKYFSRTGGDGSDWMIGWKTTSYKINEIKNGVVDFESTFDKMDPNNPGTEKKYFIRRKLPYADFILLMEDKQLYGYENEPKDKLEESSKTERDAMKGGGWQWFSIGSIIQGFKTGWKTVVDEKIKAIQEGQNNKFKNYLYSKEGLNLYEKGSDFFSAIGLSSIADAFDDAAGDFYAEREDRTWKLIDGYYQRFDKDPHFASLWFQKLQFVVNSKPEMLPEDIRYKFAAAMLVIMKKDGPWSRQLEEWMGKGEWVARILGKEHVKRFKHIQELKERELENHDKLRDGGWKNPKAEQLNRLEFDYIIGVLDGRAPYGGGDENYYASIWGRKFVGELEDATNKYYSSITEQADKIKNIKDFSLCEQEYYRNIGAMKPHKGIPYLIQMLSCAASTSERQRAKGALVGAMLSGLLWLHADAATRGRIKEISRTIGFKPGLWAKDSDHKEKLWILLKHITDGEIEKDLKADGKPLHMNTFTITGGEKLSKFLKEDFWNYWKGHGDTILEYLSGSSKARNEQDPKSIMSLANQIDNPNSALAKAYLTPEFNLDSIDQNTRTNYEYNTEDPRNTSKSMVSTYMPRNGKFVKRTDEVDIEAAKAFWNAVSSTLPNTVSGANEFKFLMTRFVNWFSEDVFNQGILTSILKTIPVVQNLKRQNRNKEAKYILWHSLYGNIIRTVGAPPEFSATMEKFVNMVWENIEYLNLGNTQDIFGDYTNTVERDMKESPYKSDFPSNVWENFQVYTSTGSGTNEINRRKAQFARDYDEENYVFYDLKQIRADLLRKGIRGGPPAPWK